MSRASKKLNLILTVVAFVLLLLLLFFNRQSLSETWTTLQGVDWRWLLFLPALQLMSHFFIAHCYSAVFRIYGYVVSIRRTLPMVWALNFVNQILPSGGLSGLSYLIYGMRGYVPPSKATLAQLARYVLSYFSYALVLGAAFILLVLGHDATRTSAMLVLWLVGVSLVLSFVIVVLGGNERFVKRATAWLGRFIDRLLHSARRRHGQVDESTGQKITRVLNDFYKDYRKITKERRRLIVPLIYMIASTFFETMVVYASFLIVGADVNPGIVLISFAIANGIGVLSVVPGDVGVHETAMIAALSAAGVPVGVAFSGTLLYRVFNKMLFLPLGFVAYSRLLKPVLPETKKL